MLGVDDGEGEEPMSDEFLANKAASLVYKQAVTSIPGELAKLAGYHGYHVATGADDVEFRLSFLPVYQLFSETTSLQEELYKE